MNCAKLLVPCTKIDTYFCNDSTEPANFFTSQDEKICHQGGLRHENSTSLYSHRDIAKTGSWLVKVSFCNAIGNFQVKFINLKK